MAKTVNTTIKFTGQFDTSQITKGLQDIKKQVSGANISDELKKQFETAFNKLQVNIPALEKLTSKEDFNLKDIEALQKLLKEVTKDWENLNKVTDQIDLSKTFSAQDLEKINNLDKQIKQTQDNIQKARKELVDAFTNDTKISISNKNVSDALTELFTVKPNEIDDKFKEIQSQFSEGVQQTQIELENKLKNANIQKTSSQILDYFFGKDSGVEFANKVGPVRDQLNLIIRTYRDAQQKGDIAGVAEQIQKLNEVLTNTANFKFPEGHQLFGLPTQEDLNTLNQIGEVLKKVKELAEGKEIFFTEEEAKLLDLIEQKTKAQAKATEEATKKQEQFGNGIKNTGKELENLNNKVDEGTADLRRLQRQGEALEQTFGSLARRIENSVSALAVFNKSTQIIRNAIKSVEDLDSAFTQIAIVSGQSGEAAWKMFDSFNSLAKQYSITTKDLTEGAKLFYQQGLSAADTMKMVEASTVSAALGEVTMTEAANTLTAAIQGYNESAAVAMDYTDKIAMVGAVSAADFNELSTAMEKTASSAYTAGIDFDHLLGYLGKMIEVTREAPANLGTAMKTIIARFEDMKKDPMAILEDGVSANKVEAALATIGIALRDSEGEFRALQDVMDELGMKWNSLTRNQQAYIATVAAGSRQQSRFLALMNNYDRTLDLITESQNSAGAAAQQYATYQDSITAAQARLTASWENFYSKIVDNSLIKGVINGLSELLDIISKIPPIITAIGASFGALALQNVFKILRSNEGGITKLVSGFKDLYEAGKNNAGSFKELVQISPKLNSGFGVVKVGVQGITSTLKGATKAATAFVVANKWWFIGAAAVAASIYIITKALNVQKEAYEQNINEIKKLNEEANEYATRSSNGSELFKTYDELSGKISLTEEEQTELNNTIKQISEIYPEAITYLDQYGNMQIANAEQIRDTIEAERQLAQERKKQALEKRGEILEKPVEDWKKEDFDEIGFSNRSTTAYFSNKNLIKQYKNTKNNGIAGLFTYTLNELKEYEKYSKESYKNIIDNFNSINKEYKLNLNNLSKDASAEEVYAYYEKIANYDYDKVIETLENTNEKIRKALIKENNLELSFAKLNFSDNSSIATSQRVIASQIQSMLGKMDVDIWEEFFENNGGSSEAFAKKMQEIIDVVSKDNGIELNQLFKDFDSGEISATEFFDKFLEIANQSGNSAAINFANSFSIQLGQQLDKEKEKFKEYLISLGVNEVMADIYSSNLELGEGQQRQNYIENYGLDSLKKRSDFFKIPKEALDALEKDTAEAIKNGDLEALESLPERWAEKWNIMDNIAADIISYGATADAIEKMIEERANIAFENIGKAASQIFSKKDFSSIEVDEAVNYMGTFGGADNFLKHAKMGDNGKFEVDTYGQVLMLRKQINDEIIVYDKYIADIERLGEKITPEEKKQLEYWKKLKEEAIKQKITVGDIVDLTEDLKRTVSEVELPKITGGGIASENARALDLSIDIGKEYENIVDLADKLEKQMKDIGHVDDDIVKELLSYGSAFEDFFVVQDDGTIEMQLQSMVDKYGSAAEAIKDIANKRRLAELEIKKQEMLDEADYSEKKAEAYEQMALIMRQYVQSAIDNEKSLTIGERREKEQQALDQINSISTSLSNVEAGYKAYQGAAEIMYENLEKYDIAYWNSLGPDNIAGTMQAEFKKAAAITASATLNPLELIINKDREGLLEGAETYEQAAKGLREYAARLRAGADKLKVIDPTVYEKLANKMEQAGKAGEEAGKAIAKAIADAAEAIINLNNLVDELKERLKDIKMDYNPFTDIFEEWEHEWDYFYNIKRLISEIGTQGTFIDNIISSDYATADQKLEAQKAKVGNILAKMGANDTYITALRAGMSQTGVELMKDYGEYYKIDPETGQIYQTDKNLTQINDTINQRKQEIYDLQKLQNEKENDLALEETKLDALEEEKSAYEDILDEINSQIDSLKDNEDITVDLTQLEEEKKKIETKIEVTDDSINKTKDKIEKLEDEIDEIDIKITLKDQTLTQLEDYVDKMEDKVSEYEEYWENLNSTIAEQQELLQELTEIRNQYIETAINTEQELYDAIVENYQKEIDQKKKQYDYLKQLDNEYLQSIKDNINKERQAREDANTQKSYQQNIQRAQLLQMDTSGAYREELANLNKEIESQRQDLYDDLVDKQVEALEKEIEKRHELYDKEVAALEERLAYMQENAILLWEMVNGIVSEGSEAMMAILEQTAEYVNSNELQRQQQRETWEYNVKATFEGTKNGVIDTLNKLVKAGNDFIVDKYPEVGKAIDNYKEVFDDAKKAIDDYTKGIQTGTQTMQNIFNEFMIQWNTATSNFTGYAEDWNTTIKSLTDQISNNIKTLESYYDEEGKARDKLVGSIEDFKDKVDQTASDMYDDFIKERQKYRDELNSLIKQIESEISAAIASAANAIQNAANSIQANNGNNGGNNSNNSNGNNGNRNGNNGNNNSGDGNNRKTYYLLTGTGYTGYEPSSGYTGETEIWNKFVTMEELEAFADKFVYIKNKKIQGPYYYAKGGLANFTGLAWLDGTKSNPERILSPKQTKLFESMVSSLERTANNSNINSPLSSSYNIGDINTVIQVEKLNDKADIDKIAKQVEDKIVKTIRNRVTVSL